ncbi:acyl-CoA carboxylase epsilon subunit [Kribbella deserti]|uniref:Acyl-CoA carboxylase epsilon subunit n=1 Tax=Kribbella deserti TaxID=1926257 RepID=A0ABV6QUM2_9ACTN
MTEENKPVLQVVKGEPTPEELAALVAVVAARATSASAGGTGTTGAGSDERSSDWASYWRNVHRPLQHGPGRWRASAHP